MPETESPKEGTPQKPRLILVLTHEGQPPNEATILDCDEFVLATMNAKEDGGFRLEIHSSDVGRPVLMAHTMRTLGVALSRSADSQFQLLGTLVLSSMDKSASQLKKLVKDAEKMEN